MLFTIFQSVIVSKNRFLSCILFCFFISINSQAQNLLALNNNPGFEGTGGFQANGYTNISPGTSGTSVPSNYAITGDSGPMNLTSFKSVTPHSGTKMMVVDANNQIFWQGNPNIQLIGGVTYTFSYWIVNVNKNNTTNPAVINFAAVDQCGCTPVLISGSQTVNNGAWQQVVYQFTPSGTGAKWVRFELSTPGATASGNDFAIDDISLYEPPKPITLSYTKSDITCPSNNDGTIIGYAGWGVPPYTFTLTGPTVVAPNTTGIFSGLEIGSYSLTVIDSQTTPDTKTITPITLVTPLDVSVVSDAGTCLTSGSLVKLTASNAGPIYTWKDSSGAILGTGNPFSVNPIATSTYTVESTSTTIIPASNIITNGDFESGNVGFKSDYGFYAGNTSGAQKAYGIQSDPSMSFTTFEKCGDKTFGSGLMMVVDGATDGTSVVWSQTVHVENNTNYDFFFYVQNLTPSNKATFSVTIGGTPITLTTVSATNSGSAAPAGCGWTQIKGTWPSGLVTPNPEIKIIDTKTNSAGNDFGIDDITFIAQTPTSKTCNLSKDITVNINPTLTPTINCGTSTTSSVQFTWAAVSNATDYSVSYKINAAPTVTIGSIGNVLDYTVNSLTSGDNVTITLTPIGGAGTCFASNTQMCTASNCIPPTISGTLGVCNGLTTTLTGSGTPDGTTPWVSSTPSVATVNSSGVVTGVSQGTSTITYKNNLGCTKTATVTVNALPTISGNLSVCNGLTTTLTGSGSPDGTTPWTSATTSVATINNSGVVTGISQGTSVITYKNSNGCIITATVTVNALPTISGTLSVCNGLTTTLTGSGTPDGTTPWTSATTSVATINSSGVVTGISQGTSVITYKNSNGCIITATVTVNALPTISGTLSVCNGLTTTLTGSGTPDGTTPWASATTSVATINSSGVVTGISQGTSVITYKNSNGCIITATVTVNALPTISGTLSVCNGLTTSLTGSGTPDGTTPWTSATTSVATINSSGVVTGISQGTSVITYKNSNGCIITATITVNAIPVLTIACGTSSSSSVTFNWNSIADATNYNYSYSIESGAPISGNLPASATTLTVNGLTPGQNVEITLIPTGSVCGKQAISNCVSSNCPSPIVDVISDIPTCANDNVTIPNFTSVTSPVTFKWTNTNTSIGIAANGTGTTIPTFKALNSTTVLQTATISVTADDGTCTGPAMVFNIDVYPLPTVSISAAKSSVCSGSATTINFNGTPKATVEYTINSGTSQFLVLDDSGNATLDTGNLSTNIVYDLVSVLNPLTNCSQTQSGNASVSINPLPTATISGSTSVCSGGGTSILFNGTPNATVTYTVNSGTNQTIPLDSTGNATLATGNLTIDTNYNLVSVVNTTTTCSQAQSGNASVTVDPLPVVVISGTTSICTGTGTSILFSGTPNAVVTFTINSGTNQTIVLDNLGKASIATGNLTTNTDYNLVSVQDLTTTCFQAQSGKATVTIISLPTATISGTTAICSGSGTSIQFNGTPNATVTYTINSGINQTIDLDTAGKATLQTGNLIANTDYSLVSVVESTKTCSQPQSGTATISINSLPTATISGTTAICSGTGTTILFNGTPNATVTYIVNSGANQTITLDAAGNATLPTGNLISNTIYILVSVSDGVTFCSQPQSGTATVTITPLPTVTISGTTAICLGSSSTITFTGTPNATVTYTVNSGIDETIDLDATGKAILPTGILITNTNYSLVSIFDSSTTCSQTQLGTATVSISVAPDVIPSTTNQPICSGQSSGILLSSSISGTVFSWTVSQSGVTGASNDTGNVISQVLTSGINVGTADYTITPTANGCSGSPVVVTVTVSPAPTVIASPNTDSICSGTTTAIALSSNSSQTTFDWNVIQNNVSGAIQGSGNTIAQELKTTLNNIGEAVYSITPTLNGCSGLSILVPITVNPVPVASATTLQNPICSGNATKIDLTSNVAGTTFTWSVIQTNVIGAVPGSGNTIAQTLSTSGIIMGTADYTITPQINSCIGNPIKVSIQVNPTPEVFGFSETTICSGDSPKISLKPIITGTTFSWTALPTNVTGAEDGTGDTIDQILIAENNPGKVIYTVTPELNGCIGKSIMITVNVDPSPSLNLENGVLCLESDGTLKKSLILDTNLSDSLYNFEWYFKDILISGAVDSSYEAEELGEYYVKVTNTVTGCSLKSNIATVSEVNPTNEFDIIVSDAFTENASITVTGQNGVTTYLYQIDNGAQQTSNVFTGIGGGFYTIRVTDTDGCTDYTEEVLVIDYPKYFTPNGDGFNDTWNIKGLSDQPNASLLIFDRYGKLLKQISPKGEGWDGTFNGTQLPATDYWFTVDYIEPKTDISKLFKAHFSLKR